MTNEELLVRMADGRFEGDEQDQRRAMARATTTGLAAGRAESAGLRANEAAGLGLAAIAALSDDELIGRTRELAQKERRALAELLAHLGEMDARRLYARFAASSLFDYCVRELGFSEPQAFLRIRAARAARRHRRLLGLIASGALHLSGVKLIAPALDGEDAERLIELACGKTCREIEALLADRRPRPSVAEQIRKLPTPARREQLDLTSARVQRASAEAPRAVEQPRTLAATGPALATAPDLATALYPATAQEQRAIRTPTAAVQPTIERPQRALRSPAAAHQPTIERPQPLGGDRFKVVFTADGTLVGLLEELRALYSHRDPKAELATIVADAAKMLRDALLKQRFGVGARPRKKATPAMTKRKPASRLASSERKTTSGDSVAGTSERKTASGKSGSGPSERKTTSQGVVSRQVPVEVRREVFRRDQGRCGYVDENGERCGARGWLELHHCDPWGAGGAHAAENVALRCRAHNAEAALRAYGREKMRRRGPEPEDPAT